MKLTEYLTKTRKERTNHVVLSTPCVLDITVSTPTQAARARKALLEILGVENNVPDWRTGKVCCAHLCENHSHSGYCANPLHLYVGTPSENELDKPEGVRKASAQASHQRKDELGRSVTAVRAVEVAHLNKNEEGKSVSAVKGGTNGAQVVSKQVWVSLADGFVSRPLNVAQHNRGLGADPSFRVQLTAEEVASYTPLLESFEFTTLSTPKVRAGKRVPTVVLTRLRKLVEYH